LQGDPALISRLIDEIDRLEGEGADLKPFSDKLIQDIGNVLGQNHVHALPLMKRILCDKALSAELRAAVLRSSSAYQAPQAARLLADLIADGRILPDAQAEAIWSLGGLTRFFQPGAEDALREAGRRAYEASAASTDPKVRAAATSQVLLLNGFGDSSSAVQELLRIFRTDPALDVQVAASSLLRFSGYAKGDESMAVEMARIVSQATGYWARSNAMGILLATETELARKTVWSCLADEDPGMRRMAICGVGQFEMTEAQPILSRWLLGPEQEDETTRIYCIDSLQLLPTLESARTLLGYVAREEEATLKDRAATALLNNPIVHHEDLADELIRQYHERKNTAEEDCFLEFLGKNDTERAYDVLSAAYAESPPEHQLRIASVLLGYGHAEAFASKHFPELVATECGESAVRALGEGNPDRAILEISKAYPREGVSLATRRAAIGVLEKTRSLQAVEVLGSFLKTEKDEDLRRALKASIDRMLDDP